MKIKTLFLGLAMLLSMASAFAQGGTIGPLRWNFENGTLTISGNGDMPNFMGYDGTPWWKYNYQIGNIVIENGVTSIGEYSFVASTNMRSVSIPNSVTRIGESAFDRCIGFSSIILPNSITNIGIGAFAYCSSLATITLPSNVASIENGAFAETSLTSITNLNPVPIALEQYVFYNVNTSACTLYVPMGSVLAYQRAEVWKEFNIIGIEIGVEGFDPKTGSGDQLVLYPNPSTGTCNITIPEEFLFESSLTLSIYDNSGKLLQQIPIENGAESFNVQLEHRAAGVYPVVLSNGKKSYRGKIVFK